jgi:hypothetical protein
MQLTEAQKIIVSRWTHDTGELPPCPKCGTPDNYDYGEIIAAVEVDPFGNPVPGQFAKPLLTFVCDCGHVLTYSANKIHGLI